MGVNPEDEESVRPFLSGFVVKELFEEPSNWRSRESLGAYMARHGVAGISGIDMPSMAGVGVSAVSPPQAEANRMTDSDVIAKIIKRKRDMVFLLCVYFVGQVHDSFVSITETHDGRSERKYDT